uniref:EF-hand domain-containing protein n=1 Tax=Pavo cristatus TaxID=9049 RepID=A0A8C9FBN8_PAVCR
CIIWVKNYSLLLLCSDFEFLIYLWIFLCSFEMNGDGMIDKNDLRKSCFQLNLNLDGELLDSLFDYCDLDKDGLINYQEFANFLNWKDKMAIEEFEEKIITKGW